MKCFLPPRDLPSFSDNLHHSKLPKCTRWMAVLHKVQLRPDRSSQPAISSRSRLHPFPLQNKYVEAFCRSTSSNWFTFTSVVHAGGPIGSVVGTFVGVAHKLVVCRRWKAFIDDVIVSRCGPSTIGTVHHISIAVDQLLFRQLNRNISCSFDLVFKNGCRWKCPAGAACSLVLNGSAVWSEIQPSLLFYGLFYRTTNR